MELKSSMTTKKNYKTTYKRRICRKWRIKYYLSESKALGNVDTTKFQRIKQNIGTKKTQKNKWNIEKKPVSKNTILQYELRKSRKS